MSNQEKLLKELEKFFRQEEIYSNLWICSLYDLYMSLTLLSENIKYITNNLEMKEILLKSPFSSNVQLIFDCDYARTIIKLLDNDDVINIYKFKNENIIYFHVSPPKEENIINIYKNFFNKNYDFFSKILSAYEEYMILYRQIASKTENLRDTLFESLFESRLSYNDNGDVNISLKISEDIGIDFRFDEVFIEKNKERILKRFPVHLDFIDHSFSEIYKKVYEYTKNYNLTKNNINKFLAKKVIDNKNSSMEIISLDDLLNTINLELEKYKNVISNLALDKRIHSFIRFEKDNIIIRFENDKGNKIIEAHKNIKENYFSIKHLTIKKNKILDNVIKKKYDIFLEIFIKLEEYMDLLGVITQYLTNFENDVFKISLLIEKNSNIDIKIIPKTENMFLSQKEDIYIMINKQKKEILKRIIVFPYTLPETFNKIYNNQKENLDSKKNKVLEKI